MPTRMAALSLITLLSFTGCNRDEVRTYRVPKEATPASPGATAANGSPAATASGLTWSAPDHWEELSAGGMRRGSFTLRGEGDVTADLSIIAFPGDAGGLAANVNRWRGQIGLAALSPDAVQSSIEHADTAHFHVDFVTMTGEAAGSPTRIDGAIFNHGGESWFVKLMGPSELIAAEAENFRAFVGTIGPAQP
ncbi:MAG: hypothetical protein HOH58_06505 [Opitutaceae bacterium]|nr:hypothetical protein [Opitutaceae bacterium]